MQAEHHVEPLGSTKRKRSIERSHADPQAEENDHTRRQSYHHATIDNPEISPVQGRNVRRKKGKYSLSSLNKRHAPVNNDRSSKFLEGSMGDRPSAKPPSVYIRQASKGSLTLQDALMDDYMNEQSDAVRSIAIAQSIEKPLPPAPIESPLSLHEEIPRNTSAQQSLIVNAPAEPSNRFSSAATKPLGFWDTFKKIWRDTEDDITRRNLIENRRKAAEKAAAEQKYAEMKAAGEFAKAQQRMSLAADAAVYGDENQAMIHERLGAGEITSEQAAGKALLLQTPLLQPRRHEIGTRALTPSGESSPEKALKTRRSFFSLRKPSFSNLKKVRSDYNLGGTVTRLSTDSLSPDKQIAYEGSALRQQPSKRDLHRQQKLSKRVSDLESKLQEARRELNSAITNASPLPVLPARYERFTPSNTLRRSKFIPGKLQTLPSESILFPSMSHAQPQTHLSMENAERASNDTSRQVEDENLGTESTSPEHRHGVQIAAPQPTTTHVDSVTEPFPTFDLAESITEPSPDLSRHHSIHELMMSTTNKNAADNMPTIMSQGPEDSEPHMVDSSLTAEEAVQNEPASVSHDDNHKTPTTGEGVVTANRTSSVQNVSKKRKTFGGNGDKLYKPDEIVGDDEDEIEDKQRSKKKRKSSSKQAKASSKITKTTTTTVITTGGTQPAGTQSANVDADAVMPSRVSLDSTLEPIFEEETIEAVARKDGTPRSQKSGAGIGGAHGLLAEGSARAGAEGMKKSKSGKVGKVGSGRKENFEWPEDVF